MLNNVTERTRVRRNKRIIVLLQLRTQKIISHRGKEFLNACLLLIYSLAPCEKQKHLIVFFAPFAALRETLLIGCGGDCKRRTRQQRVATNDINFFQKGAASPAYSSLSLISQA